MSCLLRALIKSYSSRILSEVGLQRLYTHLGVLGNPVTQHVEHSVGSSSADDEFFVTGLFRVTKTWGENKT